MFIRGVDEGDTTETKTGISYICVLTEVLDTFTQAGEVWTFTCAMVGVNARTVTKLRTKKEMCKDELESFHCMTVALYKK